MPDLGLRKLGSIVPGRSADAAPAARRIEPAIAPPAAPPPGSARAQAQTQAQAAPERAPVLFRAETAENPRPSDASDETAVALLAELALHRRTQTPFSIGLVGPSGSGKSVVLNRLVAAVERLAAAARAGQAPAFLGETLVLRLDAADMDGAPATALAGALYGRLAVDAPQLGLEASHAARDPGLAAREAYERLDAASRKLQEERRSFDEAEAHRARLMDIVLYETPGSRVDAEIARRRGAVNAMMSRLGPRGDAVAEFKDMARGLAEARGPGRAGFIANLFWGLRGQSKRLIWAGALALAGFGIGVALNHQAEWTGWIAAQPDMGAVAGAIRSHVSWLEPLRLAAYAGAAWALLSNLWRGGRLLHLLSRAEELLKRELTERGRDADGLLAHQARRVQDLAGEVDRLSRKAAEAERRARGGLSATAAEPSPFVADLVRQQAQRFIAALGAMVEAGADRKLRRVVLALDNLDMVTPERARELLRFSPGPGYVSLVAVDPARIDRAADLEKWIAAPLSAAELAARRDPARQLRELIGAEDAAQPPPAPRAALDEPLGPQEESVLECLAPVAGGSARALKRFVNLYLLLRAQYPGDDARKAALALALAVDAGGGDEFAALEAAVRGPGAEPVFDPHRIGPRLAAGLQALAANGARLDKGDLRAAIAEARLFSFRS